MASEVEPSETISGFRTRVVGVSDGLHLFAHWRILAAAKLFKDGSINELVITGGRDKVHGPRGEVMKKILVVEHGVPEEKIRFLVSEPNTAGNAALIKQDSAEASVVHVMTNAYHAMRTCDFLADQGLVVRSVPAESVMWDSHQTEIEADYRSPEMLARQMSEVKGLRDVLENSYKPGVK